MVTKDVGARDIWNKTKKICASEPHYIQTIGLHTKLTDDIKSSIDSFSTPLYKLTWKYDHGKYAPDSVLYYILEGRHEKLAPKNKCSPTP